MKKRTFITVVSGLVTVTLFIWIFSYLGIFKTNGLTGPAPEKNIHEEEPVPSPPLQDDLTLTFSPDQGEILSYHVAMSSDAELPSALFSVDDSKAPPAQADPATHLILKTSGDLFLKYYHPDQPGHDINVAGVIEGLSLTLNDKVPNYTKGMSYPFAFEMDTKGYLNDFTFTAGVPDEAQLLIKTVLYAMQTVYPKDRKRTWQTREIDATGQYQADYHIAEQKNTKNGFSLTKTKRAYLMLHGDSSQMAEGLAPSEVRIETSRIETLIPSKGAWIVSTDQNETSDIMSGTKKLGRSITHFSAVRQDKQPSVAFAGQYTDVLTALQSSAWLKEKYTVTDPGLNALSANLDLDAALKAFLLMHSSQTTAERQQAEKFMINYLRQHPQACYDLIGLLDKDAKKERFSHEDQLELWYLITKTGHEDAQKSVLEAIKNQNYSNLTHIRALAYINDFEYPEPFVVEGLWSFYNDLDLVSGDEKSRELGTMALYAIGTMGSDEKLNQSLKPEIGKGLTDSLQKAQDPEIQTLTLQAIGNYGGTDVLSQVDPFFTSDSERVRVAAYEAIRRMQGDEAFDTFKKHYSSESSQKVRTSALKILESMPVTQTSITWAGQEALKVDNSADQESLVKVLGQNLKDYPQSEQALRQLLDKKPSNIVKKTVYRYITP
ncbi:MAG: HEAT repeat domain-containing protein [Proteobacteria bacterium]|nr:HEAT repeat domain-containing protein [Pseudomonadota bacterium]